MRVVFVGFGAEQLSYELLGAILKRDGHDVSLVYHAALFDDRFQMNIPWLANLFDGEDATLAEIVRRSPDVVAFSALTNTYTWCLEMARKVKDACGAHIIVGGVHPSAAPEVVIQEDSFDAICIGEGDDAFPAWVGAVETDTLGKPIPNLWFKTDDGTVVKGPQTGFLQDLDSLPFFDKSLYDDYLDVSDLYMTLTGRGCPYRCTFCFNNFWAKLPMRSGSKGGKYVRQRSVENVIAELKAAKKRYNIRFIDFEDDVFTVNRAWTKAFLKEYKREINVPWMCLTHPKYVDKEVISWMKEAGCTWVQIGIQSVDEHYKYKTMKRYEKSGHVADAIDDFMAAGIKVKGDHIFGSTGEDISSQQAARVFYSKHTPARVSTFWMTYYPGVDITREAVRAGVLTEDDVARFERGYVPAYHEFGSVQDPDELRELVEYEALFRMMPAMPAWARSKVNPQWFRPVPTKVLAGLSTIADIGVGFAQRNPDHLLYAKYYLQQMWRHARTRAPLGPPAR